MSDGTFSCTPTTLHDKFHQFYVWHGEVKNVIFPLAFALMEKRKAEDYSEAEGNLVKIMNDNDWPIRVANGGSAYHDMERAAINSNNEHFPGCQCKLCFFHITQMSNKVITDLGFKLEYGRDEHFRHHVRMINSIVFIP